MGQSFSTIVIKCEDESAASKLVQLRKILDVDFVSATEEIEVQEAMNIYWESHYGNLIVIYSTKNAIKIEDVVETIMHKKLIAISKELSVEILRAGSFSTAQVSAISIYQNGMCIREKCLGEEFESLEEMQKYIPDATEEDLKQEFGTKTAYEINGSDAFTVLEEFEKGYFDKSDYENMKAVVLKLRQ